MSVVDAISAEQIGQFPDSTIGGAISRIPGVTSSRDGSVAGTSNGEVTGITIDGFGDSFDEILQDGRQVASGNGQSFDFADFSSMYVGEIEVYKTPNFALSSGAVGGTINVKYPNPFDNPGMHAEVNVSEVDNSVDGSMQPNVGALWSDTFDNGKFGILIDGDYQDKKTLWGHVSEQGWKGIAAGGFSCADLAANYTTAFGNTGCSSVGAGASGDAAVPVWYPQELQIDRGYNNSRRKDGRVSIQWHPTRAVLVTLDDNFSSDDEWDERFLRSTWFGSFPDATLDGNGTITDFAYTGPTDMSLGLTNDNIVTNTPGINVLWDVNSAWTLELDADQSVSQLNPEHSITGVGPDVGYGDAANNYTGGQVAPANGNALPYWSAYGPNAVAGQTGVAASPDYLGEDPPIIGSHVMVLQTQENTDQVNEATIRATWTPGNSTKVSFGAQFLDDDWNAKEFDTFTNNYWELWSGYGPASGNGPGAGVALPASMFSSAPLPPINYPGMSNLPPDLVTYNPYAVIDYLTTQPVDPSANATAVADGYPAYTGGFPAEALNPGTVQHVSRMNYAPFVEASHSFRVGGMTLKTRLGLRYQKTDSVIAGLAEPVTSVIWEGAGDPTAYSFVVGKPTWTKRIHDYGYFLPELDLNLLITRKLQLRFDVSKTETAPPNASLIPNTSYGGRVNALTASGNNPYLLPYLSDNYHLGLNWYYAPNDYAAIGTFYKAVSNFPTSTISSATLPIDDPAPCSYTSGGTVLFTDSNCGKPMVFAMSTLTNAGSADVVGVTAAWQQMLWYGFGFSINGAYVHSNANFNNYSLTSNQFALPGIGSSANGMLFYQRDKFEARAMVQWQAAQLLGLGQNQGGGAFGNEPTYLAASTYVDVSASYQIDKYVQAFFSADNLTNSVFHTYGRFRNQTLDITDYGSTFTFGVRAKF